ncbi:MAG: hypothetical protein QHH07_10195 [Sedimentisphaerales bacterium]|nr:hypothetical protein [Sedimentisphaerales bacterium]
MLQVILLILALGQIGASPAGPEIIRDSSYTGLVPLCDLGLMTYKGQDGGLYGNGQNSPPGPLQAVAWQQAQLIQTLDTYGRPSEDGKIGLISLGMSNTTQEFTTFKKIADLDPDKSPSVVIVDCAQGGQDAYAWAHPEPNADRTPWLVMDRRLEQAGLSAAQVQVVWIKQALKNPAALGPFPKHAQVLRDDLVVILQVLKARFPNLRIAYLSSRIYAGYATTALNPEPYAYESAFAIRWLIDAQWQGDPDLNWDPDVGPVMVPLLLWGPYLWADGINGRKDGLVWLREDFGPDGTHPSESGRLKVAQMLLAFFKQDPSARCWFVGNP